MIADANPKRLLKALLRPLPKFLPFLGLICLNILGANSEAQPITTSTMPPPATAAQIKPIDGDYLHLQKKIYRWSDQTKFVLVHISTPSHLTNWQAWNPQIIKDAFAEWQRVLDNRLIFVFMNDTTQADIVVNWWAMSTPNIETGAAGINMMSTWGKYIAKNDIFMALHDQAGHPHSAGMLYAASLHEIGHALGIQGHSDNPNDIMYFVVNEHSRLSQRDINTLHKIYASKPDYTNPPGFHLSHFHDFQKTQKKSGFRIPIIIPIPI